jgi:phosphoribosylamine--glycine ligase
MRLLIVGGGGREHALAWKIAQSPEMSDLYCIPGNPGIAQHAQLARTVSGRVEEIARWAQENKIDLVVVGPEAPLAEGIVDLLEDRRVPAFGPTRAAARIEGSKVFAKQLMKRHGIPTADFEVCQTPDEARVAIDRFMATGKKVVVKADGLAAGKGSIVTDTREEALDAVRRTMVDLVFGPSGKKVVIEERLRGPEASILAVTDGTHVVVLPPSQDHKPIGENDTGPNTGGMGAYSPVPFITEDLLEHIIESILRPVVSAMRSEGYPYRGTLYAGLIVVDGDPYVIEFNCRFGDPEAQAVLPVLGEDLVPLLRGAAVGAFESDRVIAPDGVALCVVMASRGYPGPYEKGAVIRGLEEIHEDDLVVFHAGTAIENNRLVTAGGRVLGVTGVGRDFHEASKRAYAGVHQISFEGAYYRRDIGYRVLETKRST